MKLSPEKMEELFVVLASYFYRDLIGENAFTPPSKRTRKRGSLAGVRKAINEMFATFEPLAPYEKEHLDAQLQAKGLPSLEAIETWRRDALGAILKRKRIKDGQEYDFVKTVLDDAPDSLDEKTAAVLSVLLDSYAKRSSSLGEL